MRLLLIAILLVPAIGHSEEKSFLCIAEYGAGVTEKNGKATGSVSGVADQKYLVDSRGLRRFGTDDVLLNKCDFSEGRPSFCEKSEEFGGVFAYDGSTFKLFTMHATSDETLVYSVAIGTCSSLVQAP